MKNKILNKILRDRAKKNKNKFWMKRIGRCNPSKCGGACCRYKITTAKTKREYHDIMVGDNDECVKIIKVGKLDIFVKNTVCPNMTIDCKCKLHNKRKQPYTCDVFPMHPDDGMYIVVKKYCSYKFKKVYFKNDV